MPPILPTDDRAIIIKGMDGLGIEQCLEALGKIICLNSIQFVSDIISNEIYIYLDTKMAVAELVKKYRYLFINGKGRRILPLISQKKRVVISNIPPSVPDKLITKFLVDHNIEKLSPLLFMKTDLRGSKYSHILSFKRQIYISPEDVEKVPHTFYITHGEGVYKVFTKIDTVYDFNVNEEVTMYPRIMRTDTNDQKGELPTSGTSSHAAKETSATQGSNNSTTAITKVR